MQTLCTICQEVLPLDNFLFLPCGHGFCQSCIQSFPRPLCPICRGTAMGAHRIYVHSPDSAIHVGDSISVMQNGASVHVDRLSSRIRNRAVDSDDLDTQNQLLEAASSIEAVLGPLCDEVTSLRAQNETLLTRVADLEQTARKFSSLETEHSRLKKRLVVLKSTNELDKKLAQAVFERDEALKEKDRLQAMLHATKASFVRTREGFEEELGSLRQLNANLEQELKLNKKKLKALGRQQKRKAEVDDEDSLIVE